ETGKQAENPNKRPSPDRSKLCPRRHCEPTSRIDASLPHHAQKLPLRITPQQSRYCDIGCGRNCLNVSNDVVIRITRDIALRKRRICIKWSIKIHVYIYSYYLLIINNPLITKMH